MHTIYADFQRFREVDLSELIGAVGVYVIWDAHAKARPTYIGEGNILKRFTDHAARDGRRFSHPWNGYVSIISGSTYGVHKDEASTVERLLLDVARDTDRMPINTHPGSASAVRFLCRRETLRVVISRYDPLTPPAEGRPLSRIKEIKAWNDGHDDYCFDHNWRFRRRRAAFA